MADAWLPSVVDCASVCVCPCETSEAVRLTVRLFQIALQIGDKYRVTTPVNWKKGDDVIVHPTVSNEEAKTLFPDFKIHKVCLLISTGWSHQLTIFPAVPKDYSSQGRVSGSAGERKYMCYCVYYFVIVLNASTIPSLPIVPVPISFVGPVRSINGASSCDFLSMSVSLCGYDAL